MAEILALDDHRKKYPLPCIQGEPLRWHTTYSSRYGDEINANPEYDAWLASLPPTQQNLDLIMAHAMSMEIETYPVIEYTANAERGCKYIITFDSKSGTFELLHMTENGGELLGDVSTLKMAKRMAEKHRLGRA